MNATRIIVGLVLIIGTACCQWIDPHDMNTNSKNKLKKHLSMTEFESHRENPNIKNRNEEDANINNYHFYLKRFISLLVNSANLDKSDPALFHGHIVLNVNKENYKFLTEFALSQEASLDSLRKLDSILSECVHKTTFDEYMEVVTEVQEKLYHSIFNQKTLWLLGVCLMLYIAYQLIKAQFSMGYVIKYLLLLVFIADFGLRYILLSEEVDAHNMKVKYSLSCDTTKMNWSEYLSFYLRGSKDCEMKQVVTPLVVFLFQLKHVIIEPLQALGTGLGGFGKEMFVNLGYPWNFILWPVMLTFCIIIIVVLTFPRIRVNLFHMIQVDVGQHGQNPSGNSLTGRTLDKLIDALNHRPQLEEVNLNRNKKSPAKTPKKDKTKSIEKYTPKKKGNSSKNTGTENNSEDKVRNTENISTKNCFKESQKDVGNTSKYESAENEHKKEDV